LLKERRSNIIQEAEKNAEVKEEEGEKEKWS